MTKLKYLANMNLVPGIHEISWQVFVEEFGFTDQRQLLIDGMKVALNILITCNCKYVYIDGSFTTKKFKPGDWDGCFDPMGMNLAKMINEYPFFTDIIFNQGSARKQQKDLFKGEIYPCTTRINLTGNTFLDFFQTDKDKMQKGIIKLSIENFIL